MAGSREFSGFDFDEPKGLKPVQVQVRMLDRQGRVYSGPSFPLDAEAGYMYYSRLGGFVPPEVALDTTLSNPFHYGAAGFEGERILRTPFGDGFVGLENNAARFIYSSLAFNLSLVTGTMDFLNDPQVERVEHLQRTPQEFFDDSVRASHTTSDIRMKVRVFYRDGHSEEKIVPFELKVLFGEGNERVVSLKELMTATCALAFLNRLPRGGAFEEGKIELIPAGYFRKFFWVSGEYGLKVPTLMQKEGELVDKPLYYAIATLPWGKYLSEDGYRTGLDLLIAPLRRIDDTMPVTMKIAGNYVNCARNINFAMKLGFGEILALNHKDQIVEGSAENIVFLVTNKKSGKMRLFCPPLSSNILSGTNRNRVLQLFDEAVALDGRKIELVMKAPSKKFVLGCLREEGNWEVSAVVLMGTGVGMIHGRSITYNPEVRNWMAVNELRSEESARDPLVLGRLKETEQRYPVNGGMRHQFVDLLQKLYVQKVLSNEGAMITPAYSMDYDVLARLFGLGGFEDLGNKEFRTNVRGGYFQEKINGVKQPDELKARYKSAYRAIENGIRSSAREPRAKIHSIRG